MSSCLSGFAERRAGKVEYDHGQMDKQHRDIQIPRGACFSSYDSMLSDLVKLEVFTLTDKWDTLLEMARKRW